MKKEKRNVIPEVIFIAALLAFIISSFVSFTRNNDRRTVEQNDDFIKAATVQTAERVNELIAMSQRNLEMMVHFYPAEMDNPEVDTEMLKDMISRSYFDYVEFISADGMDLAADGRTADLADREYFIDGMKGNSGKCVVHNSRITNETLLIFYSPFTYDGEIVGVLSGILRGDTVREKLTTDYFGVPVNTYLLEKDGGVVIATGDSSAPENLLVSMKDSNMLGPEDQENLERALGEGVATNFNYRGSLGMGSAYVTPLECGDWIMLQNFPSALTKRMTDEANNAGIRLEIKLIFAFLLYLAYLVFKNQIIKKRLVSEKEKMSGIVDVVTELFTRFALVDFESDTYEYLGSKIGDAPDSGTYSELVRYLDTRYIEEDDSAEKMSVVIARDYVQKHLTKDVPYLQFEYQIDMDGKRWENLSILCLERKDGLPSRVLYAIQDVTALKEKEQQIRLALREASEAAEAANHAKSDFLARMSHDIRTPMNAIMGMTAVAAMHLDDKERLTDCLGKITISSRHLLALINDVLDMSKIESGKVTLSEEPFNIADMVDSILTIIRPQTNSKRQELKVHITDIGHENVIGDTLRIRQVFVNILGNAVKFTPEGGTITFSIRERESLVPAMACYEFVCEDTGIGMDEEFMKTIFDPFTRSNASVSQNIEGTGLGMSITRNIVRMMEGDIQVESQPGAGSKFTVRILLKRQGVETEDVRELADLHVLVADDDPDSCVSTCDILESIGMVSEWVLNGDDAIRRTVEAHENHEDFSAVILDWKMPGKDGVETAKEIRRLVGDHVPIIILSAYDWSDIEAQAREAGIQAFIEKPLFRSRLIYALKSVLSEGENVKKMEESELKEASYSGKRVLLVEDNELNREIAKELLSFIDVETELAEDGQIALNMVQDRPPNYYDLIFMDIQMPVMDGYEAARRIRALGREDTSTVPIIAMTANAFADDIRKAHEAGMDDHLAKPVEVSKLLSVLDKWLRGGPRQTVRRSSRSKRGSERKGAV